MVEGVENFKSIKECQTEGYQGVDLKSNRDGSFEAGQPHLIQRIIKFA